MDQKTKPNNNLLYRCTSTNEDKSNNKSVDYKSHTNIKYPISNKSSQGSFVDPILANSKSNCLTSKNNLQNKSNINIHPDFDETLVERMDNDPRPTKKAKSNSVFNGTLFSQKNSYNNFEPDPKSLKKQKTENVPKFEDSKKTDEVDTEIVLDSQDLTLKSIDPPIITIIDGIEIEYADDILSNALEDESTYLADAQYVKHQSWGWSIRLREVNRIMKAHYKLQLKGEILFLCINLFDRYCSHSMVDKSKADLISIACLNIAIKFTRSGHFSVKELLSFAEKDWEISILHSKEKEILFKLKFEILYTSPLDFLTLIIHNESLDPKHKFISRYFLETTLYSPIFLKFKPSLLALASLHLSFLALNSSEWVNNFERRTGYTKDSLSDCAQKIISLVHHTSLGTYPDRKFSSPHYGKITSFIREWVEKKYMQHQNLQNKDVIYIE